jgi:hypothetical protein
MDDPWGSPWADESPRPLPKLDKLVSKNPVTPDKALVASQDSRSPWDDDDGFGEWATLPATDELQADAQDGPEQAESVEWNASVKEELTQGKSHIRPDGSGWFSREIQPTSGGSLGLEMPPVAGRSLSPDPWAQDAPGAEEKAQSPLVAESNACEESTTNDTDDEEAQGRMATAENEDDYGTQAVDELDKSVPPNSFDETSIAKSSINQDQDGATELLDNTATDIQAEGVTQGESLASRPSSSPSDHSHHDEVLTESPRTSFEEEEKKPRLEREGSSKVKEMVRLFDGLATDEGGVEGGVEIPGHAGGIDATDDHFDTPVAAQSEDDFGDFEEGTSHVTTKAHSTEEAPTKPEEKSLDKADVHGASALPASTEEPTINTSDQLVKPHDPVHFETDLSLLSHIFGQTPDVEFVHADPKQAPEIDTIIQDSFSSTDERKTWYRISRYSTMRKHNAGDEDSYVRINWKDAKVRAKTLKIVERWIEEDRTGGGAILGGGTRLGSMFGWGQKNAAPMSVAAALASRSGKEVTHLDRTALSASTRNSDASPIHGSSSSRTSLEQMSASRNSFQSPASATAPQFSWSTETPISATAEATLPALPPPMSPKSSRQPFGDSSSLPKVAKESSLRNPPASASILAISKSSSALHSKPAAGNTTKLGQHSGNQNVPEPPAAEPRSEMDDDWGEMISSPALSNPPPINEAAEVQTGSGFGEVWSPSLEADSPATILSHPSEEPSSERMIAPQSVGGIFIPSSVEDHAVKLETTSSAAPKSDAWATADFSFFDSPAPSRPTTVPRAPIPTASIPSLVPIKQSQGSSREQAEQDRIVKSIVQNLPDLSYMLRR